ncbi:MAG: ABC transporter ATP-binding protein [Anaerolineales bacterium]|nr:ABC transporter ATP-binding protein [Anaerolineales bacterium]MCB9128651.1 ABC transporter ATP-binding protein [Ardenticatenales bacterium]MCB9172883.1 ABC transporter ATP-binding protein [Ardenticatenales bacterium]
MPVIELRNLHFSYPALDSDASVLPLLRDLSLTVAAGERVALMGATGSGKSSLALLMAALAPNETGGTLRGERWILGHDLSHTSATELSDTVGLLFQQSDQQLFNMSVEDEISFGLEGLGLPIDEINRRIDWVLARTGLTALRDRAPWQLSGGEQKRLAIAAVLAMRPRLLLLDEPMAGLDPLGRRAIADLLDDLKALQEITILVIEQDAEWIARWADRVVLLHEGRILRDGPTDEVLSEVATLHHVALWPPQMAELADALHLRGRPLTTTAMQPLIEPLQPATPCAVPSGGPQCGAAPPAVQADALHFAYPDGPAALHGLSLTVSPGEWLLLAGPNGGGKSTFAKHLNGLLRPDHGSVSLFGQPTAARRVGELAREVGFLFQNPDLQLFATSVRDELAFGPRNLGLSEAEVQERVGAALDRFALAPWADTAPAILGYGLRRLVTIAAVWAMQPPIWLLDEPTTGLDRTLTLRLLDEMVALHQAGHTLLLITHDLRLAAWAERMVVIAAGRVALDGSPRELLADYQQLRPFGLRPPAVSRLARKVDWLPAGLLSVDEVVDCVGGSS